MKVTNINPKKQQFINNDVYTHTPKTKYTDTDSDTDTEFKDAYHTQKETKVASTNKSLKQAGNDDKYQIKLSKVKRDTDMDLIHSLIGQIAISYEGETDDDGNAVYSYGTGTVYKRLAKKYFMILTCGHNVVHINDTNSKTEKVAKIFFLPKGHTDQDTRLVCVDWRAHPWYNVRMDHCPNDLGIVLAYYPKKYYENETINFEEYISINGIME